MIELPLKISAHFYVNLLTFMREISLTCVYQHPGLGAGVQDARIIVGMPPHANRVSAVRWTLE